MSDKNNPKSKAGMPTSTPLGQKEAQEATSWIKDIPFDDSNAVQLDSNGVPIKKQPAKEQPRKLTFEDFLKETDGDPVKAREWLAEHPGYVPGEKTKKWLEDNPVPEDKTVAKPEDAPEPTANIGEHVKASPTDSTENTETSEEQTAKENAKAAMDDDKLAGFWKAFKSGSLKAYPFLQSVAEAISRDARMTADRASMLTGGERDAAAYETINPNDYVTDDYKVKMAIADATEGDMTKLGELIASGDVTLENAAAALNITPEELEQRFGQTMRTSEAETKTKELEVENTIQTIKQSNTEMVVSIENAIQGIDQLIYELSTPNAGYDTYKNAMDAYLNSVTGIKTSASTAANASKSANTLQGSVGGGRVVDQFVKANISDAQTWGKDATNTSTTTTDILANQNLAAAKKEAENGRKLEGEAANALIESLKQQRATLEAELQKYKAYGNEFSKPEATQNVQ